MKASQTLAVMRSRCESCANVGCRVTPGKRRRVTVIGSENTEEWRSGTAGLQVLRFNLVTHDKLFNAGCSWRSVNLIIRTEVAQFSGRIAADLPGQRGTGYREMLLGRKEHLWDGKTSMLETLG